MTVLSLLFRLTLYGALLAAVYYVSLLNVAQGGIDSPYFSEAPQTVLLIAIISLGYFVGRRYVAGRSINTSIAVFFVACLCRESDNELDALFYKGAWNVPAFAIGIFLVYYVASHWRKLTSELKLIGDSAATGVLSIGLMLLMVFSRLWGSNDMWRYLMPDEYNRTLVRVSEEGLELMAYTIIFIGMVELAVRCHKGTLRLQATSITLQQEVQHQGLRRDRKPVKL